MTEALSRKERLADVPTAVYRFYGAGDELLYLGITHDLETRWANHSRIQPWWLDVVRKEVAWYGGRAEAEAIEASATAAEKPIYDRAGSQEQSGPYVDRLALEVERAIRAISDGIGQGVFPLWSLLPSYVELSMRFRIPIIAIARAASELAGKRHRVLVYHRDQFAVSRPDRSMSKDAERVGLLFFLASNAFEDRTFTLTDIVETLGCARGTGYQHLQRWRQAGRVEEVGKVAGRRALLYRIAHHPESDPPEALVYWKHDDVEEFVAWLRTHAAVQDLAVAEACFPVDYIVPQSTVRMLKALGARYAAAPGCRPEWGIEPPPS